MSFHNKKKEFRWEGLLPLLLLFFLRSFAEFDDLVSIVLKLIKLDVRYVSLMLMDVFRQHRLSRLLGFFPDIQKETPCDRCDKCHNRPLSKAFEERLLCLFVFTSDKEMSETGSKNPT